VLAVLAGGIATVLGLKVCAAIPAESRVSPLAFGAFVAGKLCFLAVIVGFFMSWQLDGVAMVALVLGGLAHVLFAAELRGVVAFLGHRWLTTVASGYVAVAAVYSVFLAVVCLTPMGATFNGQVAAQGVSILVGALLLYLLSGAYTALQRAQQGLPVEAPAGARAVTTEVSAEPTALHKELSFRPAPPPETFQFNKNDVDGFQAQDSTAGKAIVALMTGVFSVGVILYTIIAIMAAF
jgi:hypothetical protein